MHVDGRYAFSVHLSVAIGLAVGQEVTDELRSAINEEESLAAARVAAERYLSYRPRSVAESRRHLEGKGYPESIVEMVVNQLVSRGLLDDQAFARFWVEQRETFKPRSARALRAELAQKGVSRQVVDDAVADQDDLDSARAAARQRLYRLESLAEDAFRLQLGRALQRRGFGYGTVKTVVGELWEEVRAGRDELEES